MVREQGVSSVGINLLLSKVFWEEHFIRAETILLKRFSRERDEALTKVENLVPGPVSPWHKTSLPVMSKLYPDEDGYIQQLSDLCSTDGSKSMIKFSLFSLPAQLPDLNSMEDLWDENEQGARQLDPICQVIYSQFGLAIHQNDHQARRRFVEWAQNEIAVVPDFNKRILFSDEAHFWLNGYVNKQNCRIWSEANPQVYVETPLHPEKLTVWCALWAGGILLQKR
ncbi:hypothetical protein TNCV_4906311 [Trichonephila clavipes]|uniref:Transposase n=1 Tax=Trichonephila clavipes TaxID=2585209 RepID=A0A8X6RWZ7_TRICX|nr:hypothetical protein TNCV_4906311 [Trichonephila clavipes]